MKLSRLVFFLFYSVACKHAWWADGVAPSILNHEHRSFPLTMVEEKSGRKLTNEPSNPVWTSLFHPSFTG